jgi:hypothetical protein
MPAPPPVTKKITGKVVLQGQTASEFGSDPALAQEFVKGEPKELRP